MKRPQNARWVFLSVSIALLAIMYVTDMRLLAGDDTGAKDPQTIFGGYDIGQVMAFLTALGENGRADWRFMVKFVDASFIAVFVVWAILAHSAVPQLLRRAGWAGTMIYGAFDIAENVVLLRLVDNFTSEGALSVPLDGSQLWVSWVTTAKLVCVGLVFIGGILASWRKGVR